MRKIVLQEHERTTSQGQPLWGNHLAMIDDLKVRLTVMVGKCELTVKELTHLTQNTILKLDRKANEPVDIMLDGKRVARGVLVAVDDEFGVKVTDIAASSSKE